MSMYIGYYVEPTTPVHETIVDGTEVQCNFMRCTYVEKFDSIEDAEDAARIHEERDND